MNSKADIGKVTPQLNAGRYYDLKNEMMNKTDKANLIRFIIISYLLFWALLACTGLAISLGIPPVLEQVIKNVIAWAPTFTILILFKKLYPDLTFLEYLKSHFQRPLKPRFLVFPLLLQFSLLAAAVFVYLSVSGRSFQTLKFIPLAEIVPTFIIALTSGPLGEELGWRGYALQKLQKKYSPLLSSIILGAVWGFWHLPLWFLSGYGGMDLVLYIGSFMAGIISTSVIITFFYNKNGNILVAVWIHFLFNFMLKMVQIEILLLSHR